VQSRSSAEGGCQQPSYAQPHPIAQRLYYTSGTLQKLSASSTGFHQTLRANSNRLPAGYFILFKLLLFPIQTEMNTNISSCLSSIIAVQELMSIFRPSLQSKLVPQIQFHAIAVIGTK